MFVSFKNCKWNNTLFIFYKNTLYKNTEAEITKNKLEQNKNKLSLTQNVKMRCLHKNRKKNKETKIRRETNPLSFLIKISCILLL